jgi:hypothetical protein
MVLPYPPAPGQLSVRRGLHRVSGHGLVYEEPTAERSRRTLALPAQLVDALRAHRAAQLEERIAAGPLWEDNDLVFARPNGRPIERKSDWRAWKALLREAGVPGPAARRPAHRGDAAASAVTTNLAGEVDAEAWLNW